MKKTNIINILAGIGAVSILLISFSVALNPNDAQQALTLGGLTGVSSPSPAPSGTVASSPASPDAALSCGYTSQVRDSNSPNDVAFASDGTMYVANSRTDQSGKGKVFIKSTAGIRYLGDSTIIDARGVAIFDKYVLVADYGDATHPGQVLRYKFENNNYTLQKTWTSDNIPNFEAFKPTNIITLGSGVKTEFLVVNGATGASNPILKFGPFDDLFTGFIDNKTISAPIVGIASNSANVFVSTSKTGENKIWKLKLTGGNPIKAWGETGNKDSQFGSIGDLAISSSYIFVADPGKGRISQFDLNGKYLASFGGLYDGVNYFQGLTGMTIGIDGQLYFTNNNIGGGLIIKFDILYCGVLQITKDVKPATDSRDFAFSVVQTSPLDSNKQSLSFYLDDDKNSTLDSTKSLLITKGKNVVYAITETEDPDIDTSYECSTSPLLYGTGGVVNLVGGATGGKVTCIFTNQYKPVGLTVIKKVLPNQNPQDFNFELYGTGSAIEKFTLDDDDNDGTYRNTKTFSFPYITNIKYQLTELPTGNKAIDSVNKISNECKYTYTKDGSPVKNPDGSEKKHYGSGDYGSFANLDLKPGQSVTCAFTNDITVLPPAPDGTIRIFKDAQPNTPSNKYFYFNFKNGHDGTEIKNIKLNDSSQNNRLFNDLYTGPTDKYTMTETADPDYDTWVSCRDYKNQEIVKKIKALSVTIGSAEFAKAKYITCTFENIKKPVEPPGGPTGGGATTGGGGGGEQ